jgi:hypothetical protein
MVLNTNELFLSMALAEGEPAARHQEEGVEELHRARAAATRSSSA